MKTKKKISLSMIIGVLFCIYVQSVSAITIDTIGNNQGKLTVTNLTYSLTGHVEELSQADMNSAVQQACAVWSSVCNLRFTKVSSGANIVFAIRSRYIDDVAGAVTYGQTSTGAYIDFCDSMTLNSVPTDNVYTYNMALFNAIHELGHAIGMSDKRGNPSDIHIPRIKSDYYDTTYFKWRMSFIPGVNSVPPDYSNYIIDADGFWANDTHISVNDYDNGHWGVAYPNQMGYICAYDIALAQAKYGTPTDYKPLIVMQLGTKHIDGINYQSQAFVTTSWDSANSMCREYNGQSDIRFYGLVSKTSGSTKTHFYRYYNPTTYDYCVSSASSKSGWTQKEDLGYWWKSSGAKTINIAGISTSCATKKWYQYSKSSPSIHLISTNAMTEGWDNWYYCTGADSVKTYVIGSDAITQ